MRYFVLTFFAGLTDSNVDANNVCTGYCNDIGVSITRVRIATVYILSYGKDISTQKEVVVHEFGHALGYRGHSPMTAHVMYESVHENYTLSPPEIKHIKQVYD